MTGLQVVVNIVLGVLAFLVIRWVLGFVGTPETINVLVAAVVGFIVVATNTAARLGVK